jgi:hypothetical protein
MHSTKLLMIVCTMIMGAGLISARAEDNPAQAAARAALMNSMNGWSNPSASPKMTTPPPVEKQPAPLMTNTPASASEAQTATTIPASPAMTSSATASSDTEAQAKARAALEQKMKELDAQSSGQTASPSTSKMTNVIVEKNNAGLTAAEAAAMKANSNAGKNLVMQPILAPPLPISPGQQMQLDALLTKYKANQITPEEYQKQRAAILAEP